MGFSRWQLNILVCVLSVSTAFSADLPTLYQYYTSDGIASGLSVDKPYFTLNDKNITILSGAMHYFRIPPQYWQDRLRKLRAAGLNTVETYVPWNLHEPENNVFDFGNGGTDMEQFLNLEGFLTLAQQEDLFVIIRPGPYICAEWEWGGFPSWLMKEGVKKVRSSDEIFMKYVERYFNILLPILAKYQFSFGGSIIAVQVENEYGNFVSSKDQVYLQQLKDLMDKNEIVELLVTSDNARTGSAGTLPGVFFQTVNSADPPSVFAQMEELQPNKPILVMEYYPGWFDHWSESHHTTSDSKFKSVYEGILSYPASVNLYMFHGGTNWGFMNGATPGSDDNANYAPTTTSYDYDAPITEAGDYSSKYDIIRDLVKTYNPVQTLTPDPPALIERKVYSSVPIDGQLSFTEIVDKAPVKVESEIPLPMEYLPINNDSGQSYGYIIYHKDNLTIPANSILTITAHLHDTVMVLVNGVLVSKILSSSSDFDSFGYWRLDNSSITLTTEDLEGASLDLVVENWGRGNSAHFLFQFKGLIDDNHVLLNGEELSWWIIYPLEFKKSWSTQISGWNSVRDPQKGPGLYRATLVIEDDDYTDTFVDMSEWNKGIVLVNGFVLGRYAFIGPQQTLYLPAPLLKIGDNEIIIFEQFEPATEVKFSKNIIFNTP